MDTETWLRLLRVNVGILAKGTREEWLEGPCVDRVYHNAEEVPWLLELLDRATEVMQTAEEALENYVSRDYCTCESDEDGEVTFVCDYCRGERAQEALIPFPEPARPATSEKG